MASCWRFWADARLLLVSARAAVGTPPTVDPGDECYWDKVRCYPDSLIARKFSLFRRLGNSIGKRLNFLPKAEAPWQSQARNRRISLYLPVEQGTNGRRPVR
jgi:hypothetical protein